MRTEKRILAFWPIALLLTCAGAGDAKPFDYELSPRLLNSSSAEDTTLGLGYSVSGDHSAHLQVPAGIGDMALDLKAQSRGTVALDEAVNPDPLVTSVNLGLSLTTGSAAQHPYNGDPDAQPGAASDRRSFGDVVLGLSGRHETDQTFDEQTALFGVEAGYINIRDEGLWGLVPTLLLAYEWGDAFESETRDLMGLEDSSFRRWRVDGSLKARFGQYLFAAGMWRTLTLHLEAQYYWCEGQPEALASVELDDALYAAASLSVRQDMNAVGFKSRNYYVKVSSGRPPPLANGDDDLVVSVGVKVSN